MKKFCTLFFAVACCSMVFGQIISVTDGTLADWDNVPSEYLFKTECAPNASMNGLKSVQVYVDLTYINLLVEVNDDVVTDREWPPFHVFINSDNNAATGGFGDQWTTADVDVMLETAIYSEGAVYPYNPAVFKWWGPNGENGWQWTDPNSEATSENGWGAWIPEGSMPIGNSQMVEDGKIEIQLDYKLIPFSFDETTFTLGFDILQSWTACGILPNASDAEDGSMVLAEKLRVYVHPQNSSMRLTIDDIQYKITSNAEPYTAEVVALRNTNITEITIPETIVVDGITYNVTSIGNGVFYGCSSLTSVTIPNSVTSIGNYAFYGCSSLTSIIIPNSVTSIGERAFSSCTSLTSITIPNSVTSIGNDAFRFCSSLTSITIPNSVTSIGYDAFRDCSSLSFVILTAPSVEAFCNGQGNNLLRYAGCSASRKIAINGEIITSITIPNSVTSIGDWAFYKCSSLTSITIPESVTSIGRSAFFMCSSLTSITIPNSVTSIGDRAFYACSSLASMVVEEDNTTYDSRDNCNAIIETATNTLIAGCQNTIIPNSVTSIGYEAFAWCSSLTSITIPNSVTSIGNYAFRDCSSLDTIYLETTTPPTIESNTFTNTPASICYIPCGTKAAYEASDWAQYMGEFVEEGCVDSTMIITYTSTDGNIVTPYNAEAFGANIVSNTYENGVGTITFDGPVTSIGNSAFTGCRSLTSITIPNSVTSIGSYAFDYCRSLTSITIPNSVTSIGEEAFQYCSSLTSITIPNSVTSIRDYTFQSCSSLCSITIPNSITSIGRYTFSYCSSLTSIAIPNSVTSIGDSAFRSCTSLTSITIPNSVTSIGNSAFLDCSSMVKTYFTGDITDWCKIEFVNVSANPINNSHNLYLNDVEVKDLIIPEGVTSVGNCAFYSCSSLTSVTIPNSVTSIGAVAFMKCSSLTFVAIGDGVTTIGDNAFFNCSSLDTLYIEATTPPTIGNNLFYTPAPTCYIPCGTKATYETSDWAQYMSEFVEECEVDSTMIITYTSTDGNVVTPYNAEAFGANIVSNTYENGIGTITFDAPVTSFGDYAFQYCSSLTTITIPNSLTSIGEDAFYWCSSLTSITIPNSVTSIGRSAFYSCSSLTSITIPNSVTSIGDWAFAGCSSLDTIYLEATTPPTIESNTFTNTPAPTCYIPCGTKAAYEASGWAQQAVKEFVEEGCVDSTMIITYTSTDGNIVEPYDSTVFGANIVSNTYENGIGTITFDAPVTSIGVMAFDRCSSLASIIIPDSVTYISCYAFNCCSSLTSIVVESGNTTYDSRENCNAIIETATNILIAGCPNTVIPNSVTSIGSMAFYGRTYLTSLTIPNSVTSIEPWVFCYCSSLTSITIGNSLKSIGYQTFSDCSSLDTIYVEASTPPALGEEVFTNTTASICYIPCGTKAAYGASDWAQYMGEFVEDCDNKCGNQLYCEYSDTQLSITGYGDMYDYDIEPQPWQQHRNKITQISLPEGMTSVGAAAFADCKYVTSVAIPATVEKIHDSAFEDCRMLSSLSFAEPSALTSIGNWAFYNCHKLQYITIPEGVTEIGEAAFFDCTYLSELTLPATMEYIADNGFGLCAKLKRINVSATTPPAVEARTFEDVDRSIPVYVPDAAVNDYKAAPVWQEFNIVGKEGVSTSMDNLNTSTYGIQKLFRDGNLVIIRDGVEYNVMGQQL